MSRKRVVLWVACSSLLFAAQPASATPRGDGEAMEHAVRELGADHDRATQAVYTLQSGGAPAADAILLAWPSLPLLAQKRAIAALRPLCGAHAAAVDALVLAARSDDAALRQQALAVLAQSSERGRAGLVALLDDPRTAPRAAALLARAEPDFAIAPLLDTLAAEGGAGRVAIRDALSMAVERAADPEPALRRWLDAEPPHAAAASAALALSPLDTQRESLASFIVYALPGSTDFETAWRLLRSAGSAPPHPRIDRWLAAQLSEPDEWMLRAAAVDALATRDARAPLRPALSDSYPRVRMRAAAALSGDAPTLIDRASLARKDTWPMVRAAAVTSLRSEADALPVVVAAVNDGMSLVRVAAIEALTPASHDEGWEKIHGRLRATDEWPRVTAAAIEYARAHCRTDSAESLFRVVLRAAPSYALTEDLNNAALAIEALRALGTPETEAFIEQLRRTPEVPPTLKMALEQPLPPEAHCRASSR